MNDVANIESPAPEPRPPRRTFFERITYLFGGIATAVVGLPFVGYVTGVRKKPITWVPLGSVAGFPLNETRLVRFDNPLGQPWDGIVAHTGVYVRNQGEDQQEQFLVLAMNCAHLGCPVSWFPQSGLFMCPCHGGVYYATGERASGPPPRGMFHCVWRIQDGQLEVQAPHYPTLQDTLEETA
ncbi:MAG TPA: Rieske 2Fe-2S domain-containing protein [Pirellulales bacterium]|nr:Rieske 2Fe-2S domain-containing protein [Pirellulales bacterium]